MTCGIVGEACSWLGREVGGDEMRELGWCLQAIALEEGDFAIEE